MQKRTTEIIELLLYRGTILPLFKLIGIKVNLLVVSKLVCRRQIRLNAEVVFTKSCNVGAKGHLHVMKRRQVKKQLRICVCFFYFLSFFFFCFLFFCFIWLHFSERRFMGTPLQDNDSPPPRHISASGSLVNTAVWDHGFVQYWATLNSREHCPRSPQDLPGATRRPKIP